MTAHFLRIGQEYEHVLRRTESFLNIGKRADEQPLKPRWRQLKFVEFEQFTSNNFKMAIKKLSKDVGDSEVYFLTLDTKSVELPGFIVSGDWPFDDFDKALLSDPQFEDDPLLYFVTIDFILFGSSGKWAFYGDRDFGVLVGGLITHSDPRDDLQEWPDLPTMPWINKHQARGNIESSVGPQKIYQDMAASVIEHFGLDT
jgi:hypothetical protein